MNGWLRESEEEAGDGAEDIAENLDGTEVLGHDFVEHSVELGHVHLVHGGLDAAFDVELFDDGLGADVADHALDAGADGGDRLGDPLPRGFALEEPRGGRGEVLAQIGAKVVLEPGADVAGEAADALDAFRRSEPRAEGLDESGELVAQRHRRLGALDPVADAALDRLLVEEPIREGIGGGGEEGGQGVADGLPDQRDAFKKGAVELLLDPAADGAGDRGPGLGGDVRGSLADRAKGELRDLLAVFLRFETGHDLRIPEGLDPGRGDEAVDLADEGALDAGNEEFDDLRVVRGDLLLEERLRGAERGGVLERAADHRTEVVRELFGLEEFRRNLVGEDFGDPRLVLREKTLAPRAERRPRKPVPPCGLIGFEKHRNRDPVRTIANGGGNENRHEPLRQGGRRLPDAESAQNGKDDDAEDREEARRRAEHLGGGERAHGSGTSAVADDGKLGAEVGNGKHGAEKRVGLANAGGPTDFIRISA